MGKTLSVVMAVFNEEKNLESCLDSIKDIASEIIIVDGTSTDKTVEIAKKFKAKVKITTNKPNFHINKQMAIDMASKEWVLQLDADEHVSEELKEEIKEVLSKDSQEFNGYFMPRKNKFLGRFLMKGGQYPDYTLRLYENGKGRLPQKDVHEQTEVTGKVGYLKSPLLHFPYKNFSHYLRKWNKYNDLEAKKIEEEVKHKNIIEKILYGFGFMFLKPSHWFLTTYIRHKGFVDLGPGFVFSLFSALRFPASYLKYLGPYKIAAILIILASLILRLWDFPNRWGLGGDDGRDAMIGLEALRRHTLPLVGPFSSAGPFVFGGIYYWFISLSFLILPFMNAPWIALTFIGIFSVYLLIYLGNLLGGKKLALIAGALAATSPQFVARSIILGPHTFIYTFTILIMIFYVLLWRTKKQIYSFLIGIFLGLALSFHYQAINLIVFFPALFLVLSLPLKKRFFAVLISFIGFIIPSIPLMYWDYHQNFANLNNILDYFFIGQYRIYVPNSWKIYLFDFIPWYWSFVAGRFYFLSFALSFLSGLTLIFLFVKNKLKSQITALGLIFFIFLLINRFYKGERSEGYLLYLAPFIIIFSSFFIEFLISEKLKILKIAGILCFAFVILGNLITIKNSYLVSPQLTYSKVADSLIKKYPNSNFSIYIYKYKEYDNGMGLSYVLGSKHKISKDGLPIGISCFKKGCYKGIPPIFKSGVYLANLSKVRKEDFTGKKKVWINVNQDETYDSLITWLYNNKLESTFNLKEYIMEKVGKL